MWSQGFDLENRKMGEELLKFASVKRWIESLEQGAAGRGKELTESTKLNRLWHLWKYTKCGSTNPDDLLSEARVNIEKTMQRLTAHFNAQQKAINEKKGVDWNTACTDISFLRGFYTHNDIVFPKRFKSPQRRVSKVSRTDSKTEMYTYNEDTDEVVFENGYLKQFISNLSFRDQTVAICLLATGADTADLLKLPVGFARDGKGNLGNQKRFFWHDNRVKDNIEFKVFFSEEATQYLKRYVEQERANAPSDEPIFVKEDGQPIPVHALAMNFRCAAEKMGFTKDEKSNPFRPKRFRHIFRTACSNANIDSGFVMAFMGHASTISAGYLEKSSGLFLNAYLKVEPYLTVFGVDKTQITNMAETVDALRGDIAAGNERIVKLYEETSMLKKLNVILDEKVSTLEKQLTEVTELYKEAMPLIERIDEIAGFLDNRDEEKRIEDEAKHQEQEAEELSRLTDEANKNKKPIDWDKIRERRKK